MKEIGKIIIYFLGVIVVGALITPPLWWAGHLLFDLLGKPHWAEVLQKSGFKRYFDRGILVAAVVLLWPTIKWLGVRKWNEFGLERDPRRWRHFWFGFFIALISMALLAYGTIFFNVYHLRTHIHWGEFGKIVIGAFAVGLIEEWLFRGALLGLVNRTAPAWVGLIFISALFAIVHFLKPQDGLVAADQVNWLSGFVMVGGAFWQFGNPMLLLGGFTTLFIVGLILGYARLKTRALWMPVGLHAGWVISKMGFSKMTKRAHEHWPWFGNDILIGLAPVLLLIATGIFIWWRLAYVDPRTREIRI